MNVSTPPTEMPPPLAPDMSAMLVDKERMGSFRPLTEMLITENDTNSKCITSSDTSLEEKQISAPKFKKARIHHLMNANMLVPFIHLPPVQPPKPEPPAPKGRGRKGSSQSSVSTASAGSKKDRNKSATGYASGGNKKARVRAHRNANESVANALLALAGS